MPDVLASVLTCCDMTTSPDGQPVPVEQRLAEIHDRYGPGHLVSRSIQRATPMILRAVEQVHQRAAQTIQLRKAECPISSKMVRDQGADLGGARFSERS